MNKLKKYIIFSVPAIIIIIATIVLISKADKPEDKYITGMVEATHVDVSSKMPGRIDSVLVKEGEHVFKGQIVAIIISKELDAKLEQTRSVMNAAYEKLQIAINGARPEEKEMAEKLYLQAKHQYELTESTHNRFMNLYRDSLISSQEKDQVEYQFKAAKEQLDAAKAKWDMIMKGARHEEIMMADANFKQAENTVREILAYREELTIVSPLEGEISKKIINPGEIVASGYPVFTVIDLKDIWIVLNIKEDRMQTIKKDSVYKGFVPALGNNEYEFFVSYISPMGDFATWKPTNQKGEFDLKTFEIRLRPVKPIDGLRPGMTVNIKVQ
ncbi:MAG: efflux RND transporter periplasmic adaptor subunit [Ignavibacteriae bacterium]|nr:efflux RND transporter periplasmic adaptor subunit [Ignavibacteriota bacterium]